MNLNAKIFGDISSEETDNLIYKTIFEQVPFGIAVSYNCYPLDASENSNASINSIYEEITGRSKEEMVKLGWAKITHPEDLQKNLDNYNEMKKGNIDSYTMEKRFIRPDGSIVWVRMTVAKLQFKGKYNHISMVQDITERKILEETLIESERSKAVLISNLPGMAYRCYNDKDWTMTFVSEGCYELTGYISNSLINNKDKSYNDLISPEYQGKLRKEWDRILRNKLPFKYEYEILTAKGHKKWVLEMGQGIYDDQGHVIALEGIIIDISDRKDKENELKYLSEHFVLTGLYNQRYLEEMLLKDYLESKNNKRAILLIDMKKIHPISLTYGYNYSEKLIKELAVKLQSLIDMNKILSQIFFDKFVFYVRDYNDQPELIDLCNEIFNKIKEVHIINNTGCGIGILEIEENNCDTDSMLKNVSLAVERIDPKKPFDYYFYDEELKAQVTRENHIKDELFKVVTDDTAKTIYLEYQPILDLKTGKTRGFEALARFNCEKLGSVPPTEFIPIAEEMQLIEAIGLRVIHKACKFIKRLEEAGFDHINVSINVSVLQLLRDEFLGNLTVLIEDTKINRENLGIELTESIIMDNFETINEKLLKLKNMGIEVAIDDFGTGYSSLARESELHVHILKIDKYFIDKIMEKDIEKNITGDIISMAHRLGHLVIAEGVEHEKQYQYLLSKDCDYMQGYYFSKPLNEENAFKLLENTDG